MKMATIVPFERGTSKKRKPAFGWPEREMLQNAVVGEVWDQKRAQP